MTCWHPLPVLYLHRDFCPPGRLPASKDWQGQPAAALPRHCRQSAARALADRGPTASPLLPPAPSGKEHAPPASGRAACAILRPAAFRARPAARWRPSATGQEEGRKGGLLAPSPLPPEPLLLPLRPRCAAAATSFCPGGGSTGSQSLPCAEAPPPQPLPAPSRGPCPDPASSVTGAHHEEVGGEDAGSRRPIGRPAPMAGPPPGAGRRRRAPPNNGNLQRAGRHEFSDRRPCCV